MDRPASLILTAVVAAVLLTGLGPVAASATDSGPVRLDARATRPIARRERAVPLANTAIPKATNVCPAPYQTVLHSSPRPATRKTVALTFDDGPNNVYTPLVLDVLKKNKIRATFFLVGELVAANPAMAKRIAAEGHIVGNHTWSHPMRVTTGTAFSALKPALIAAEMDKTTAVISKTVGVRPCLFRAPGGDDKRAAVRTAAALRRMTVVNWTYDPRDWNQPVALSRKYQDYIVANATGGQPHPIVLFHDGGQGRFARYNTPVALQRVITYYRARGYSFVAPTGRS